MLLRATMGVRKLRRVTRNGDPPQCPARASRARRPCRITKLLTAWTRITRLSTRGLDIMNNASRQPGGQAGSRQLLGQLPPDFSLSPREWADKMQLRPHVARAILIGRRPWHSHGKPIVLSRRDQL